ncbi:MAG TPA: type VI secretion system baseplate subunit TssE [Bryobacteraceae bacterium]|jgi:type VI secretion system protein ImpF
MASGTRQSEIVFSLVDRLTDLDPEAEKEIPVSSWEQEREFKRLLCRDLSALLNTRRAERDFDPAFEECTNSLLSFGINDFTSYNLKNAIEQEHVRRSIERAIRQFEPRLVRVEVTVDAPDETRPVLQFQIAAFLRVETEGEPIVFDITLQRESRRMIVSGGNA